MAQKSSVGEMGMISNLRVGETGVGKMGVGKTGVGKVGVGEMGIPRQYMRVPQNTNLTEKKMFYNILDHHLECFPGHFSFLHDT